MADIIFLKCDEGKIVKVEGDRNIHTFVELLKDAYGDVPLVGIICKRVAMFFGDDACVNTDRIMARLFLIQGFLKAFERFSNISDEKFESFLVELRDRLSYSLFPATRVEVDREIECTPGGALIATLSHVPVSTFSYW